MLSRLTARLGRFAAVEFFWFSIQHLVRRMFDPRGRGVDLSSQLIRELREEGFAHLGQIGPTTVSQLQEVLDDQSNRIETRRDGEDLRVWGIETLIPSWDALSRDLTALYTAVIGPRWEIATVMGNVVPAEPTSLGSGEGWHRDSNAPQYKIMILLSAVESELDGAFTFLPGSHRYRTIIRTFNSDRRWSKHKNRWADDSVRNLAKDVRSVLGAVGDVVMFDGAVLHRGAPNRGNKSRKAITIYLFPKGSVPIQFRGIH